MLVAKRILRYLQGTSDYGVLFPDCRSQDESVLPGFSDSDWCGDKVERRSTMGYVLSSMMNQFLGVLRSNLL